MGGDSHFYYSSKRNRCWRSNESRFIEKEHQEQFCLSDQFTACPVYQASTEPLKIARQPVPKSISRRTGIIPIVVAATLIVLILGLLWSGIIPIDSGTKIGQWFSGIGLALQPSDETVIVAMEAEATPAATLNPYPSPEGSVEQGFGSSDTNETQVSESPSFRLQGAGNIITGNEIELLHTEAYEFRITGDQGLQLEQIYVLPENENYEIMMDEQNVTLTREDRAVFTQTGEGYAIRVENILAKPNSEETIKISRDGKSVEYIASEDNKITIYMEYEEWGVRYNFVLWDIEVDADHALTITNDLANKKIELINSGFVVGEYDLKIEKHIIGGHGIYLHTGVVLNSTNTHSITYTTLEAGEPVMLMLRNKYDGSLVEIVVLENEANLTYLPLIIQ